MRYARECPKCGSKRVLEVIGSKMNQQSLIPLENWSFHFGVVDRYLCMDCGFTEEYIQMRDDFLKWAEKTYKNQKDQNDDLV